ncbi:NAD(P)/FAD-dependent oxidoreductase [Clostridium sp. Sa3CUN1]|uniref:NAD(P)/FAD-dependent oxidoreductase n=1 Tax=Clostridium gallinarum TaxID=2762246 RepID=A0ABR8Q6A0_9CLOT|nr:NAD(P)/FAD-dependent oxidoreductase [Clostridium gallinarum]MBD7915956.1 NAD(P)/FAD-dependent oxidoreductase [Clostridium gallinarum]
MYDVVIIGAGVIGTSIFRELTKYNVKVAIVEKENDVSMGTSKANSAIIHAGYDPKAGTLMAKFNVKGNEMFGDICDELDVPFKRNGSLVLAFDDEELEAVKKLYENGNKIGVKGLRILNREEVKELEENVSDNVLGALYAPTGGIVGVMEYTIALAENSVLNGGKIFLNSEVVKIEKDDTFKITTSKNGVIEGKYIVNAAGVYSDAIHNLICKESFKIIPRRGEYFVMDKSQGKLFTNTVFQCPTTLGKGILVTPTVHGNLIVGPNAEDIYDKDAVNTTSEGLDYVIETTKKTTENINFRESIRNFAGLRAIPDTGDFIIGEDKDVKGFVDVAGMKSPGLSAAPAIAIEVVKILQIIGLSNEENKNFNGNRKRIIFNELSRKEKEELIKKNPSYGKIVCRCENITEGEIVDAIKNSFGSITVDGVKRRCRPGMGRCQGGFCGPRVVEIIARELNKDYTEVAQEKEGSYILLDRTK